MSGLCRDCFEILPDKARTSRCPKCLSPRALYHGELASLNIAHLDCDAFYASIEKRDDPTLRDKPVIIGGGKRGVVSTACYVARTYGVHSAQPMFKALKLCPEAVVIKPNMAKYAAVSREVRDAILSLTPLVEPLSLDEAFMDLSGTERLHHASPALSLARLQARIELDLRITVSIGLSYCKFLAKTASDLDKPRGFSVIGRAEARAFLEPRSVATIFGVGRAFAQKLEADGLKTIGDLARREEADLIRRYGAMGRRLHNLSLGIDNRRVDPEGERKSISSETTLFEDISKEEEILKILWRQCERVADRAKSSGLAGRTIALKLKSADFKIITRHRKLPQATALADTIYRAARDMVHPLADGTQYRLIGVGIEELVDGAQADGIDLADPTIQKRKAAEHALDKVRTKFGRKAIAKGRGL